MADELPGMPERLYVASPSRLLTWVTCPRQYRMQYLDRPRPTPRPQRAHTSLGIAVHNALRDWWDGPQRTAEAAARLVRREWIPVGFRDEDQSALWRERVADEVQAYVDLNPPIDDPVGTERTLSIKLAGLAVTGRVDRLDARPIEREPGRYELVVVDYKTTRRALTSEDARTSLPLALYAAAAWRIFRRRCVRVELHHVPSGQVLAHEHTVESLRRKLDEAGSIAADLRRADAAYQRHGPRDEDFPPRTSPLCRWCDYRDHCPEGQQMGPEQSSWAALEPSPSSGPATPVPDGWEEYR